MVRSFAKYPLKLLLSRTVRIGDYNLHFLCPHLAGPIISDILTPNPFGTTESLDEFKIRDMNDHINKLLREKHHWERRILELGGPTYPVRLNLSFLSGCSASAQH